MEVERANEEDKAQVEIWKYVFGFVDMAVVKCAIELGIADIIESKAEPMTLSQLSCALGPRCNSSGLFRIMRFLVQKRVFNKRVDRDGVVRYSLTPLSRRLLRHGEKSLAGFVLFENHPVMLEAWDGLSTLVLGQEPATFKRAHGQDVWEYAAQHPEHSELLNEAMACDARIVMPIIVEGCLEVFCGLDTVVDVGGGNGMAMSVLVKACPWIKGINFDLPHVVEKAHAHERVEHVGGDMFVKIPQADAAFLMWVLHDWGDEECINILRKCKEAIPNDRGKVVIVEIVIEEEEDDDLKDVRFMLDMVMLSHTSTGKERTQVEWKNVLSQAGFSRYTIKPIKALQSVIEAYP